MTENEGKGPDTKAVLLSHRGDPLGSELALEYGGIVQRTARGVLYTAGGQTLLCLAGLLGGIFLARWLTPTDFGIYAVIGFVVLKLNALAELGLNTKLIHDQDQPSSTQLRSVFSLHCLVALLAYAVLYLAIPWLAPLFQLGEGAVTFGRAVGLIILVQPLRTIPVALLSRRLQYDRLILTELADGVVYQGLAVTLALFHFSYWSFGVAALASSAVRTVLLNTFAPWRLGVAWDAAYLRGCLRFGGTFQLSSLTAVARDNIITFLGGPLFGPAAVGLLNWSFRLAWVSSQTYVGVCAAVSFPSLSRMRSDPALFGNALTKMLRYVNLATLLTLSVLAALIPEIVHLVFTDKWAPAIPLFYCFAIRMVAGNFTTLLDFGLKAQGFPERSLKILSFWTVGEWLLAVAGALLFGYAGIAFASTVGIWFALLWLAREVSRLVSIDWWRASVTPLLCAAVTFVVLYLGKGNHVNTLPTLLGVIAAGGLLYVIVGALSEGKRFWEDIREDLAVLLGGRKPLLPAAMGAAD